MTISKEIPILPLAVSKTPSFSQLMEAGGGMEVQLRVAGKLVRTAVLAGESLNWDCPLMPARGRQWMKGGRGCFCKIELVLILT